MSEQSRYTPLNVTAGAGLLNNSGIRVPTNITAAVNSYNALDIVDKLTDTIAGAASYGLSSSIITTLRTLSANTCPALSASVPTAYANTTSTVQSAPIIPQWVSGGFANLVENTAERYLGDGDLSKFATVFGLVAGYRSQTNTFIYTAVNGTVYLPTFTSMNDLITGGVSSFSLAIPALAEDLLSLGSTIDLANLAQFGTPTGLLQTISEQAGIVIGTLPSITEALREQGLTTDEIVALSTPAQSDLTFTVGEFNSLQKRAYPAFQNITGDNLAEVLTILGYTGSAIDPTDANTSMAALLDPKVLFALSWPSLTLNNILIYGFDGSVNQEIIQYLENIGEGPGATATGCDELAKIVPPSQAAASVAVAAGLQQIKGISQTTLPILAGALL
jgi:hypothetical protein